LHSRTVSGSPDDTAVYRPAMALRARTFTYAVAVDRDGTATSNEGGTPIPLEEAWTPEHLVLVGLARCAIKSLGHHARLRGLEVMSRGGANGVVTKRDSDNRYAFVEIGLELDVTLEPPPDDVRELLARAERDCFVGASLTIEPDYRWTVNGEEIR
jgi:organic hydroperoxide reductase OsmC/OhrA